ncbi:CaiB/BaiF CoA-transferase family protein [Nocardia sp. 348MFTsu5.1]|uniref:CaiB/BaiF CoA transferase family protein n=1 Tax=Nocardia sp. 348MFTsu5.1 TaxID=1172185 RepID=UPI00068768C7|nr:CoA transferase [Nocardia sp. 348MFTsu5.1]
MHTRVPETGRSATARRERGQGPLAGIRIADFCWVGVGALATRFLADFGAEVIKIEDRTRLDLTRRMPIYKGDTSRAMSQEVAGASPNMSGHFNNYNRNKLGVTINMRTDEGRSLVRRLIANSDVVTENFAPGIMERWDLAYDALLEIKSSIISARMSGFGHSGPDESYRSYGPVVQAVGGLTFSSGLPNREPSGWGMSYMDNQAAYNASAAILMALYNRALTGEGTEVDVSALEASVHLIGPALLDAEVNATTFRGSEFPPGNLLEFSDAAPHGVYPTSDPDRWVAIAVFDDAEWDRFADALGRPHWIDAPEFADQSSRRAAFVSLDQKVSEWTATRSGHDVADLLQHHGVRASSVQDAEDVVDHDPQLAHRGLFVEMDHPEIGVAPFEGTPFLASSTKPVHWRSSPLLGEDNEYVFKELLQMPSEQYADLLERGVI